MDKAPAGKNTRGDKAPADKFIDLFLYVCYTHFHEGLILQEDNFRLRKRSGDGGYMVEKLSDDQFFNREFVPGRHKFL